MEQLDELLRQAEDPALKTKDRRKLRRQLTQITADLQLNSKDRRRVTRAMQKLEAKSREEREELNKQRAQPQEEVRVQIMRKRRSNAKTEGMMMSNCSNKEAKKSPKKKQARQRKRRRTWCLWASCLSAAPKSSWWSTSSSWNCRRRRKSGTEVLSFLRPSDRGTLAQHESVSCCAGCCKLRKESPEGWRSWSLRRQRICTSVCRCITALWEVRRIGCRFLSHLARNAR